MNRPTRKSNTASRRPMAVKRRLMDHYLRLTRNLCRVCPRERFITTASSRVMRRLTSRYPRTPPSPHHQHRHRTPHRRRFPFLARLAERSQVWSALLPQLLTTLVLLKFSSVWTELIWAPKTLRHRTPYRGIQRRPPAVLTR